MALAHAVRALAQEHVSQGTRDRSIHRQNLYYYLYGALIQSPASRQRGEEHNGYPRLNRNPLGRIVCIVIV